MEKEFVSYEIALELKQLGFDEPCLRYYDYFSKLVEYGVYECKAPLYQQVFRWFREKYELDSYITPSQLETKKVYDFYIWFTNKEGERDLFIGMNNEYTYEEAEIECLLKLIEFVKESI